jgi:hypothetical protein
MKVKAAIEKEYWLLMLSQPRPAPKPLSEPPLARLSHFVYNAPSINYGHAPQREDGVVPRSPSDSGGMPVGCCCHAATIVSHALHA